MAVIIENIDVPESCDKCPLCNHTYTYYFCPLLRTILDDEMAVMGRRNDCPIKDFTVKKDILSGYPTDAKELSAEEFHKIVSCKDCARGIRKDNMVICFEDSRMMRIKDLEEFCSNGVKKEEE